MHRNYIEKAPDGGYGAYVPDLPGCIGMGNSKEETLENIAEAIRLHLEGIKLENLPNPAACNRTRKSHTSNCIKLNSYSAVFLVKVFY